jgi:hypothetical protein
LQASRLAQKLPNVDLPKEVPKAAACDGQFSPENKGFTDDAFSLRTRGGISHQEFLDTGRADVEPDLTPNISRKDRLGYAQGTDRARCYPPDS